MVNSFPHPRCSTRPFGLPVTFGVAAIPARDRQITVSRYVNLNTGPSNFEHFEIERNEECFVRKGGAIAVYCSA